MTYKKELFLSIKSKIKKNNEKINQSDRIDQCQRIYGFNLLYTQIYQKLERKYVKKVIMKERDNIYLLINQEVTPNWNTEIALETIINS